MAYSLRTSKISVKSSIISGGVRGHRWKSATELRTLPLKIPELSGEGHIDYPERPSARQVQTDGSAPLHLTHLSQLHTYTSKFVPGPRRHVRCR